KIVVHAMLLGVNHNWLEEESSRCSVTPVYLSADILVCLTEFRVCLVLGFFIQTTPDAEEYRQGDTERRYQDYGDYRSP
uniref:hypothetical protein n=1 Tax=Bifidobacterium longum TaxID=216816 RepID=UPI002990832A